MATLVLGAVGAVVGQALLPAGVTVLGATLGGAAIGGAFGSAAGRALDNSLFAETPSVAEGPRLSDLNVMGSSEGAPIPRVFGSVRLAGQLIWSTRFRETVVSSIVGVAGGKGGGGGGGGGGGRVVRSYHYSISMAVGLCEGPIAGVGRVWADGQLLDASRFPWRLHHGGDSQQPDSLMVAVESAAGGSAPGYRGTAYLVFEEMSLGHFGNRIPQLTVEVIRPLQGVAARIRGVAMNPPSGEYALDPQHARQSLGGGRYLTENTHGGTGQSDWLLAVDQLRDTCSSCRSVSLAAAWFGDDLRAGHCRVEPRAEGHDRLVEPDEWQVSGMERRDARVVDQAEGRPVFGGTPADGAIIRAIRNLKDHGFKITFHPFLLMDIPAGNALPSPDGAATQPIWPWRGRITCTPAPGVSGSPDGTAAAGVQVRRFFGDAESADFSPDDGTVRYDGADHGGYRRMVLHYAHLCVMAGGVDAFLLGSELAGLNRVRSGQGAYPAVGELRRLAADVRGILGAACKISYAADWTEFGMHQPPGSNDAAFHLDPLWSDNAIDFVGVDWFQPLSDWRDGQDHLDARAGSPGSHDSRYLMDNVVGGENFDWTYASRDDRDRQVRTPITDAAYGKPWAFRSKDLAGWWGNRHYNRPGGAESAQPTGWVPGSKPIRLTAVGCAAIDRGANQPGVLVDARSSESAVPYYSSGRRDDAVQNHYLTAMIARFDPAHPDYDGIGNPVSSVYGGPMVSPGDVSIWTWDARPSPYFPQLGSVWTDAASWDRGHWINGRLASSSLSALVAAILDSYGYHRHDVGSLTAIGGSVEGYMLDRVLSAREALEPLMRAFRFDAVESGGVIRFVPREWGATHQLTLPELAENSGGGAPLERVRSQSSDLPGVVRLSYIEAAGDYLQASVEAQRPGSSRVAGTSLPMILSQITAQETAEKWLSDIWNGRERASLTLPFNRIEIEPGDRLSVDLGEGEGEGEGESDRLLLRVTSITDTGVREVRAVGVDDDDGDTPSAAPDLLRRRSPESVSDPGTPHLRFLDLPLLRGDESPHAPRMAVTTDPWPGSVAVYRGGSENFRLDRAIDRAATMGVLMEALPPGPVGRWDRGAQLVVRLWSGALDGADPGVVLGGANVAAVARPSVGSGETDWEVIQFLDAELIAPETWCLTGLLRGQAGTQHRATLSAGADFVLLDEGVVESTLPPSGRALALIWRYGPAGWPITDQRYESGIHVFPGRGLLPLAPVHLEARRSGDDLTFCWTRCTRIGGDNWDVGDVPLGEERERYHIEILKDGVVVRAVETSQPQMRYGAADRLLDFSDPDEPLHVRVFQLSAAVGRGRPATATFTL